MKVLICKHNIILGYVCMGCICMVCVWGENEILEIEPHGLVRHTKQKLYH